VSSKGIALFFHTSQSFLRDRDDEPTKRSRRLQFAHLNFRATTPRDRETTRCLSLAATTPSF
jgi:hypothetical protein